MKNLNTNRWLYNPKIATKNFTQAITLCLVLCLTIIPDHALQACMGTPAPPCGRSIVMAKFTPGTVVFPAGGAITVPIGVLPVKGASSSIDSPHLQNDQFVLHTSVPNPFSTQTTIRCTMKKASQLSLQIFNHLGQRVSNLFPPQKVGVGEFSKIWNGTDDAGNKLNPGIYICQMKADDIVRTSKLLLVR